MKVLMVRATGKYAGLVMPELIKRGRAEAVSTAMNMALGTLRSVVDSNGPTFQEQYVDGAGGFSGGMGGGVPAASISPQMITVTADVTVDYNLVPVK